MSPRFKIGEGVLTRFAGRVTRHVITEIMPGRCQSGWLYETEPAISDGPVDEAWLEPLPPVQEKLL